MKCKRPHRTPRGLVAVFCCLSLVAGAVLAADNTQTRDEGADRELKVVVLAYRGSERALKRWASTCRRIVEAHGGLIVMKSRPEGGIRIVCIFSGDTDG